MACTTPTCQIDGNAHPSDMLMDGGAAPASQRSAKGGRNDRNRAAPGCAPQFPGRGVPGAITVQPEFSTAYPLPQQNPVPQQALPFPQTPPLPVRPPPAMSTAIVQDPAPSSSQVFVSQQPQQMPQGVAVMPNSMVSTNGGLMVPTIPDSFQSVVVPAMTADASLAGMNKNAAVPGNSADPNIPPVYSALNLPDKPTDLGGGAASISPTLSADGSIVKAAGAPVDCYRAFLGLDTFTQSRILSDGAQGAYPVTQLAARDLLNGAASSAQTAADWLFSMFPRNSAQIRDFCAAVMAATPYNPGGAVMLPSVKVDGGYVMPRKGMQESNKQYAHDGSDFTTPEVAVSVEDLSRCIRYLFDLDPRVFWQAVSRSRVSFNEANGTSTLGGGTLRVPAGMENDLRYLAERRLVFLTNDARAINSIAATDPRAALRRRLLVVQFCRVAANILRTMQYGQSSPQDYGTKSGAAFYNAAGLPDPTCNPGYDGNTNRSGGVCPHGELNSGQVPLNFGAPPPGTAAGTAGAPPPEFLLAAGLDATQWSRLLAEHPTEAMAMWREYQARPSTFQQVANTLLQAVDRVLAQIAATRAANLTYDAASWAHQREMSQQAFQQEQARNQQANQQYGMQQSNYTPPPANMMQCADGSVRAIGTCPTTPPASNNTGMYVMGAVGLGVLGVAAFALTRGSSRKSNKRPKYRRVTSRGMARAA